MHQQVRQLAADQLAGEQARQLRQPDQPVRVPGGPVVVAVGDSEDLVVGLGGLVEQLADLGVPLVHALGFPRPGWRTVPPIGQML